MKKLFLILILLFSFVGATWRVAPTIAQEKESPFKIIEPQGAVLIAPGDALFVKFKAPEGGVCYFSVSPDGNNITMEETSPGIYEGEYLIPYNIRYLYSSNLFITYYSSRGLINQTPALSVKHKDPINYLTAAQPLVAKAKKDEFGLRADASTDYDRTGYFLAGAKFKVSKQNGDWYRLNIHPNNFWVHKDSVEILPDAAATRNVIKSVKTFNNAESADITFDCTAPFAYSLTNFKNEIYLTFYNTASNIYETRYDLHNGVIDEIDTLETSSDFIKFKIILKLKNLCGYETSFKDNKFTLSVRKAPVNAGSLKGKMITLDAGHGGEDPGAVGPAGTKEKDVNFAIVLKLKALLEAEGAKVILTRAGDFELTPHTAPAAFELQARCDVNKNNCGIIAISIHNNSHSDAAKRKTLSDTDIYFYQPQSKLLADSIAKNLGKTLNKDNYFSLQRSFYLIRPTYSPSILTEVTYISNPQEEAKLKDPVYQQNAALGIFNGIKEYFEKAGE